MAFLTTEEQIAVIERKMLASDVTAEQLEQYREIIRILKEED